MTINEGLGVVPSSNLGKIIVEFGYLEVVNLRNKMSIGISKVSYLVDDTLFRARNFGDFFIRTFWRHNLLVSKRFWMGRCLSSVVFNIYIYIHTYIYIYMTKKYLKLQKNKKII